MNQPEIKIGLSDCYSSIGWTLSNQGDHIRALEYHHNALEILEELGDSSRIASVYNYLGLLYLEQSDYPQAISYLQKSLTRFVGLLVIALQLQIA